MKLTVPRNSLMGALKHVARVVERRNTIPILANIMLSAAPGKLMLRGTDLDMEASTEIDADVSEAGETTVNAGMMDTLVRKFAADCDVTLQMEKEQLLVKAGRSRTRLVTIPPTDFPTLSTAAFSHQMRIPAGDFAAIFDKVAFSISTEETRYYLCGVYLHLAEVGGGTPMLRGVATDGHRLAQHQIAAPEGADGMPGIIVPRKAVGEITKLLDGHKGEVLVEISTMMIRVTAGRTVLASKLIDGTFPDYARVVPLGNNLVAVADRQDLGAAADRVSTVSSEKGRAVKLSFKDGSVELSVQNPDTGDATEEFDVNFEGALDIGVNSKYLAEILANMKSDEVRIAMADPGSPMLFTAEGGDGSSLWILMPMRV